MATEPLKFPNLVTGFERNPAHAARAALYTRYSTSTWVQGNLHNYNEADTNRHYSERLRHDFVRVMRLVKLFKGKIDSILLILPFCTMLEKQMRRQCKVKESQEDD